MRLWIRDAQIVAPTPLEKSRGYDTRVVVITSANGVFLPLRPHSIEDLQRRVYYTHRTEARLFFRKDGALHQAPSQWQPGRKNRAQVTRFLLASPQHEYQDIWRLKRNEWPPLVQPELHIQAWIEKETSVRQLTPSGRPAWQKPMIESSAIVSRIVPLPPVDKIPHMPDSQLPTFRLRGFTNSWAGSGNWNQPQIKLHIALPQPLNAAHAQDKVVFDYLMLRTEHGRFDIGRNFQVQAAPDGKSLVVSIPSKGRPIGLLPNRRDVTFKARVSINDCWPQSIEFKVREAGKNITRLKPVLN